MGSKGHVKIGTLSQGSWLSLEATMADGQPVSPEPSATSAMGTCGCGLQRLCSSATLLPIALEMAFTLSAVI